MSHLPSCLAPRSVLLVAVLVAAIYLRRINKRGQQLSNEGGSLRSSMHLHCSDLDYLEKPGLQTPASARDGNL